jgi:hypothetical protein
MISFLKKLILFFLVYSFVILLRSTSVISLLVQPSMISMDVIEGTATPFYFNITYEANETKHNFTIYNVTFEPLPYIEFATIGNLSSNESAILNFTVLTNSSFSGLSLVSKLNFKYLVKNPVIPQNYTIIINDTGIYPANFTGYYNDTVILFNNDVHNHTLQSLPPESYAYTIGINESTQILLQQNMSFYDIETQYAGYIFYYDNIINWFAHTSEFDTPVQFQINSAYPQAILHAEYLPNLFELKHNQPVTGILYLFSNETIYHLNLSGEWMNFSENNFEMQGEKIISFSIVDYNITANEQTAMSYQKVMHIKAENIVPFDLPVNIYLAYYNFTSENAPKTIFIPIKLTKAEMMDLCDQEDWESEDCQALLVNITVEKNVERTLHPNISENTVYEDHNKLNALSEGQDRVKTSLDTAAQGLADAAVIINDLKSQLSETKENFTKSFKAMEEEKKKEISSNSFRSVIITLIVGAVVTVIAVRGFIAWRERNNMIPTNMAVKK